jgi:lysyl-tRNA synthetase class 2
VDLIMSEETRGVFQMRSRIVQAIREFMTGKGFLEVETPMMQPIPGGANARAFKTHHNALDMDLYLRVAPELYLKRLVVGGFEKVFEINRNFRNEGISTRHNPEFTMLEFYEAYRDYRYLMEFTEEMLRDLARKALGTLQLSYGEHTIDLAGPFERLTVVQAVRKFHPEIDERELGSRDALIAALKKRGVEPPAKAGLGALHLAFFEATTEQQLIQPTFIVDYPAEVSPLARRSDADPEVTDRFELYIAGREIANGFSELNDPEDQAKRFEEQAKAKAAGDEESMYYDADYIRALEYGLPPAAGEGVGIDRLVMLFTNSPSIRDVLLFPHLRQET